MKTADERVSELRLSGVAEGMGFGKPILFQEVGLSDVITHQQDGYIVPTGLVSELLCALAFFSEQRKLVAKMGQAAYETIREYSWARFRRELVQLVEAELKHV